MGLPARIAAATLCAAGAAPAGAAAPASIDVAAADNAFGFRLLNAVQDTMPGGNIVLSPVSAALDLSAVLNAAEGQTREQMLAALSLSGSELEAVNTANTQLIKILATPAKNITLSVAESLWINSRRATLLPEYVKQTKAWSDAAIADLDFSSPSATAEINRWASETTHGRIGHVIERIDPAEFALLLNAVYFKGEWTRPFDKAQTQLRAFTLAGGAIKQVPRMTQSGRFDYFETPTMQAIRLPFGAADLVMEVFLPARSSSLRELEAALSQEHWTDWKRRYSARPGTLELPRFELTSRYRLNEPLQSLGMTRIFQRESAQITGMFSPAAGQAQTARYYIGSVLQSTYWKVDEEGAEAAAVTSVGVRATAMTRPPEPFHMIVDRPFFCTIEDRRSGVLLFVGAIYNPAG
jgi:serine protease inhibitor